MYLKKLIKKVKNSLTFKAIALIGLVFLALATMNPAKTSAQGVSTPNCDANAVVYCGAQDASQLIGKYNGGDSVNSAASIHNIYTGFGISSAEVNSINKTAVGGYVTKSGDVYLNNGLLVATNALTAGRQDIAGSTARVSGGTTYYVRHPSVSFLDNELAAMVVMHNGVFEYAILVSCGNPVTGNSLKPNYSIDKQVQVVPNGTFSHNITVPTNTQVQYRILVKSTGQVPVENINFKDVLPANVTYVPNTFTVKGAHFSAAEANQFFSTGINIASIPKGEYLTYVFNVIVGPNETATTCTTRSLPNTAYISSPVLPTLNSTAVVNKTCPTPPPVVSTLTCVNLVTTPGSSDTIGNTTYTLNATASVANAKITSYVFDLLPNKSVTVNTNANTAQIAYVFAPGSYNVKVTVNGTDNNGKAISSTTAACAKTITATAKPLCYDTNGNVYPAGSPQCATPVTPGVPPTTPAGTAPKNLVNTGPGSIIGLFAGTTILGTAIHHFIIKKKLLFFR